MVCQKKINKFLNKRMLNLTIGKRYRITLFAGFNGGIVMEGTIKSKIIHSEDSHSYWLSRWDEKRQINVGSYVWDYGYANKGRKIVHNEYSIKYCEEISKNSNSTHD